MQKKTHPEVGFLLGRCGLTPPLADGMARISG